MKRYIYKTTHISNHQYRVQSLFSRKKAIILFVAACVVTTGVLVLLNPTLYYQFFKPSVTEFKPPKQRMAVSSSEVKTVVLDTTEEYEPAVDPNQPIGEWLIIPDINVKTQPKALPNAREVMKKGVWRAPQLGYPGKKTYHNAKETKLPILYIAHPVGWRWLNQDWRQHSFRELDNLTTNSRIQVITNQRTWTYRVYKVEKGSEITDYSADLILYTDSIPFFSKQVSVYARLDLPVYE